MYITQSNCLFVNDGSVLYPGWTNPFMSSGEIDISSAIAAVIRFGDLEEIRLKV
jgi:hypothetical protein